MRELTRATSEVIQRVHRERTPILVTKQGLPVALLSPIATANGIVALLDKPKPSEEGRVQEELDKLDENARRVLEIFPSGPRNGLVPDRIMRETGLPWEILCQVLARLEIAQLIRKRPWGYVRL